MVKTNKIWFYFKTIFEQIVTANENIEFFDATEGGLRIEGTHVLPLREFLEKEVYPNPSLPVPPLDLLQDPPLGDEARREQFQSFLREASDSLLEYLGILENLEKRVQRASSAGFSPSRRRQGAFEVASELDRLLQSSRIMTFILQAHIAGCARVVNESKFLQTSEEMIQWRQELEEFIGTARVAASSAKGLLDTLILFIDEEPRHRKIFDDLGVSEGALSPEEAEKAWKISKEESLSLFPFSLFSRFDFREGRWTLQNTLDVGRRALELGFVERGRKLLSTLLQNKEVCEDPCFWNDLGLSYCLYEFTVEPDFEQARAAFRKALSLDPENEMRSRNYLAMEHMLQRRAEAVYRLFPRGSGKNAAAALGRSWASLGKREKALEWYQKALDMGHHDPSFQEAVKKAMEECAASSRSSLERVPVLGK